VKKKHSAHAVTSDISIAETAVAAAFFDVDGVIVTGAFNNYLTNYHHVAVIHCR
jgi:predicted TIM-barrel enzyme